jgi:hypothetical protein
MIEKCYAAHIKTQLDATAINITRPKTKRKKRPAERIVSEVLKAGRPVAGRKPREHFGHNSLN